MPNVKPPAFAEIFHFLTKKIEVDLEFEINSWNNDNSANDDDDELFL